MSAKTLKDMGLPKVSHIATGFNGWVEDGLPVQTWEEWKAAKKA